MIQCKNKIHKPCAISSLLTRISQYQNAPLKVLDPFYNMTSVNLNEYFLSPSSLLITLSALCLFSLRPLLSNNAKIADSIV